MKNTKLLLLATSIVKKLLLFSLLILIPSIVSANTCESLFVSFSNQKHALEIFNERTELLNSINSTSVFTYENGVYNAKERVVDATEALERLAALERSKFSFLNRLFGRIQRTEREIEEIQNASVELRLELERLQELEAEWALIVKKDAQLVLETASFGKSDIEMLVNENDVVYELGNWEVTPLRAKIGTSATKNRIFSLKEINPAVSEVILTAQVNFNNSENGKSYELTYFIHYNYRTKIVLRVGFMNNNHALKIISANQVYDDVSLTSYFRFSQATDQSSYGNNSRRRSSGMSPGKAVLLYELFRKR